MHHNHSEMQILSSLLTINEPTTVSYKVSRIFFNMCHIRNFSVKILE